MLKVMKNTFKIILRQKGVLLGIILIPTVLTFIFSFLLGSDVKYGVGLVNNDNGIVSEIILKSLENMGGISIVPLDEDKVDSALVGKENEVSIIFQDGFSEDILNGKENEVIVKSISDSEIKSSVISLVESETSTLLNLGKLANGDEDKFKTLLEDLHTTDIKYELNQVDKKGINVFSSIGMVIMIILTTAFFITRFVIDDEIEGTKDRILLGNVSKTQYYSGILIVFYLCSCITSILYYTMCVSLGFDFGTTNSILYLYILFAINFLAITFNLALVSFSKTPMVAANISTVIVISTSMISGLFWPFSLMPENLQNIGGLLPMRWAMLAFEDIQKGKSFLDILPTILSIFACGLVLLVLTVLVSSKKKSIKR